MKVKLLTSISLFTFQVGISQTEKMLNGKVFDGNKPFKAVEVINKTSKTSTRTNDLGEFSILVKPIDSLLFFAKDYHFTRYKITPKVIETNGFIVIMNPITEELNEVVITKLPSIKLSKEKAYEQGKADEIDVMKRYNDLTRYIPGYKDGTIPNGMSMTIPIGAKSHKKEIYPFDFKKLIATTCPDEFFSNELKLKPEEKDLFIQFCDNDPNSKKLLQHSNILTTMDFLFLKNEEFKRFKMESKN